MQNIFNYLMNFIIYIGVPQSSQRSLIAFPSQTLSAFWNFTLFGAGYYYPYCYSLKYLLNFSDIVLKSKKCSPSRGIQPWISFSSA